MNDLEQIIADQMAQIEELLDERKGMVHEVAYRHAVARAETAKARNAELVKALERIERAIGAGISENGGEVHRVKISGKTRIEDGWLVGEFADQFREIMRTIQGIARAALNGGAEKPTAARKAHGLNSSIGDGWTRLTTSKRIG